MRFTVNKTTVKSTPVNCPPSSKFIVFDEDGTVVYSANSKEAAESWLRRNVGSYARNDHTISEMVPKS